MNNCSDVSFLTQTQFIRYSFGDTERRQYGGDVNVRRW
jgi:hypothetical protein